VGTIAELVRETNRSGPADPLNPAWHLQVFIQGRYIFKYSHGCQSQFSQMLVINSVESCRRKKIEPVISLIFKYNGKFESPPWKAMDFCPYHDKERIMFHLMKFERLNLEHVIYGSMSS
jgi:hypothetical protein